MHETSIAQALIDQVRRHTPPGHIAIIARVEAGPYQAINPQALEWAWQIVTEGTELAQSKIDFHALPFSLSCPQCHRSWTTTDPLELCSCGTAPEIDGSSDLRLLSLEVEPHSSPATT